MKRSNNTLFKDIRSHEVKARERILAAARGTYTVMDIETTGMYSDITEIAALRVVSGEIRDTFHTLVKAKGPIEKRVERLTGITSDMLEGQPPIGDVLPIFMTFIEGFPLVGHGLDSDLIVIDRNLKAVGKPLVTNDYIDTHSLAKLLLPEREGEHRKYSVKALAEYYELPCSTFHRAMDDCMAEKMLFERLLAEWK
ncbi:MAG: PolC-type DNA polymerase III [Dialister invisus]|jgi:DNA polymerase III polC-type|uniref:3'-5' exonuclease n=1 Tax=Dialister invisus TaxID=218538 RepID=UPI0026DD7593|nr:3'-5' exonuclease [Dialister invisus]